MMAVTYDRDQHAAAQASEAPLVTIAINLRYAPAGKRMGTYAMQGPCTLENVSSLEASLTVLRSYLAIVYPDHPALRLFHPDFEKILEG
jgi:hypothetical protein